MLLMLLKLVIIGMSRYAYSVRKFGVVNRLAK